MIPLGESSLKFDFQGRRYGLHFIHNRNIQTFLEVHPEEGFRFKQRLSPTGGSTTCVFYEEVPGPSYPILAKGESKCSKQDHFSKRIGRHIAFERLEAVDNSLTSDVVAAVKEFGEILRKRGTIGFPSRR